MPRASLVVLSGTLATFGLPLEGVAVILGVDELMDMARTTVNLVGNCLATAVMARWEGELGPGSATGARPAAGPIDRPRRRRSPRIEPVPDQDTMTASFRMAAILAAAALPDSPRGAAAGAGGRCPLGSAQQPALRDHLRLGDGAPAHHRGRR